MCLELISPELLKKRLSGFGLRFSSPEQKKDIAHPYSHADTERDDPLLDVLMCHFSWLELAAVLRCERYGASVCVPGRQTGQNDI